MNALLDQCSLEKNTRSSGLEMLKGRQRTRAPLLAILLLKTQTMSVVNVRAQTGADYIHFTHFLRQSIWRPRD
jgi:hypothetical protein